MVGRFAGTGFGACVRARAGGAPPRHHLGGGRGWQGQHVRGAPTARATRERHWTDLSSAVGALATASAAVKKPIGRCNGDPRRPGSCSRGMMQVHDRALSSAHTAANLRHCEARRGQIWLAHTSGGVNCETGWVAAAAWLTLVFGVARKGYARRHEECLLSCHADVVALVGVGTPVIAQHGEHPDTTRLGCLNWACPGRVVTFDGQAPGFAAAIVRAGWNDAAWDKPRRDVDAAAAKWYEQGYAGGMVFHPEGAAGQIRAGRIGSDAASRAGGLSPSIRTRSMWR